MVLKHESHRSASWQAKLMLLMLSLGVLPLSATAMSQDEQPRQRSVETDVVNKWQQSGVQLRGVPPESHFDKVLREADRKMKQLGAPLQDAAPETHFDKSLRDADRRMKQLRWQKALEKMLRDAGDQWFIAR